MSGILLVLYYWLLAATDTDNSDNSTTNFTVCKKLIAFYKKDKKYKWKILSITIIVAFVILALFILAAAMYSKTEGWGWIIIILGIIAMIVIAVLIVVFCPSTQNGTNTNGQNQLAFSKVESESRNSRIATKEIKRRRRITNRRLRQQSQRNRKKHDTNRVPLNEEGKQGVRSKISNLGDRLLQSAKTNVSKLQKSTQLKTNNNNNNNNNKPSSKKKSPGFLDRFKNFQRNKKNSSKYQKKYIKGSQRRKSKTFLSRFRQ